MPSDHNALTSETATGARVSFGARTRVLFALWYFLFYLAAIGEVARIIVRSRLRLLGASDTALRDGARRKIFRFLAGVLWLVCCRAALYCFQPFARLATRLRALTYERLRRGIIRRARKAKALGYRVYLSAVIAHFTGVVRQRLRKLTYPRVVSAMKIRGQSFVMKLGLVRTAISTKALSRLLDFWATRGSGTQALEELRRRIKRGKVDCHVVTNTLILALKLSETDRALELANKMLRDYPDSFGHHQQAGIHFFLGGYYETAEMLWSEAAEIRERAIKERGLDGLNMRLLGTSWLLAIGHIAHIDIYLKHKILSGNQTQRTVLVPPPNIAVPNRVLLDCWRPYIDILDSGAPLGPALRDLKSIEAIQDEFWTIRFEPGRTRMFSYAGAEVQQEWDRRGFPPLLRLDAQVEEAGWAALEKLGVPKDSWFVCLHVREPGFHRAWHEKNPGTRNADVMTYVKAIESVTARGGYVIRTGDPTMQAMPPMDRLVDYAHCDLKSPLLDVFLCAKARLFIGTNSGLGLVPPIFGVPCALTNWSPIALPQWYTKDRFIPKKIYSRRAQRMLTFEEMFSTRAGWEQFVRYFDAQGLEVIDDTPDEINELVMEVLDETEGRDVLTAEDRRLVQAYNELSLRHRSYVGARIGREFLRRCAHELGGKLPGSGEQRVGRIARAG